MKIIAAVLVAALGLAGTAAADPMHRRAAARARFDINRDGRLDVPERIARRAYMYARLVRRFDLDHDGRLGPGEVPPRVAQRLRRFDRNGDGWIEPGELIVPGRRSRARGMAPAPQQQEPDQP